MHTYGVWIFRWNEGHLGFHETHSHDVFQQYESNRLLPSSTKGKETYPEVYQHRPGERSFYEKETIVVPLIVLLRQASTMLALNLIVGAFRFSGVPVVDSKRHNVDLDPTQNSRFFTGFFSQMFENAESNSAVHSLDPALLHYSTLLFFPRWNFASVTAT